MPVDIIRDVQHKHCAQENLIGYRVHDAFARSERESGGKELQWMLHEDPKGSNKCALYTRGLRGGPVKRWRAGREKGTGTEN